MSELILSPCDVFPDYLVTLNDFDGLTIHSRALPQQPVYPNLIVSGPQDFASTKLAVGATGYQFMSMDFIFTVEPRKSISTIHAYVKRLRKILQEWDQIDLDPFHINSFHVENIFEASLQAPDGSEIMAKRIIMPTQCQFFNLDPTEQ